MPDRSNKPEYIQLMFAGCPEDRHYPSENSLYCNRCYKQGYVSDEEMAFLIDNGHIVNSQVVEPIVSGGIEDIENPELFNAPIQIFYKWEWAYVSEFCPHCHRSAFGDLSVWRA